MMLFALAVFPVVLFVFAVDLVHRTPGPLAAGALRGVAGGWVGWCCFVRVARAVCGVLLFVFAVALVHRTPAALAGGILLVMAGAIGQEEAIAAGHWETLGLRIGRRIRP